MTITNVGILWIPIQQASKVALAQRRPKLGSLHSSGLALIKENKGDEKFVDATKSKVQKVTDLFCDIENKIKDRISSVQTALYRCQGFDETVDDFDRWLYCAERQFNSLGNLSIKPNVIKKQRAGLKVCLVVYLVIHGLSQRGLSALCSYNYYF